MVKKGAKHLVEAAIGVTHRRVPIRRRCAALRRAVPQQRVGTLIAAVEGAGLQQSQHILPALDHAGVTRIANVWVLRRPPPPRLQTHRRTAALRSWKRLMESLANNRKTQGKTGQLEH